jgi:aldehyde:ferredoxin oxidoreductase
MVNPNGADHCANVHDDAFASEHGMLDFESMGFYDTVPFEDIGPRKVALFRVGHAREFLNDCLLLCHLAFVGVTFKTPVEILSKVTGWDVGEAELVRSVDRILTAARLFNVREGLGADDDVLPPRYFEPKTDGPYVAGLDPDKMEKAKKYYYTLMGWDENGVPLPEKVEELIHDRHSRSNVRPDARRNAGRSRLCPARLGLEEAWNISGLARQQRTQRVAGARRGPDDAL